MEFRKIINEKNVDYVDFIKNEEEATIETTPNK